MSLDADRYDPLEDESRKKKSIYVNKRDLAFTLIAVALFLVLFGFYYQVLKRQAESSVCLKNIREISKALSLYQEANNDRFPPAFVDDGAGRPLMENGYPLTWVSLIAENMGKRASFLCPTAGESELALNYDPTGVGRPMESSYGFYLPRSLYELNRLSAPGQAVVIAETSNRGALGTFDPKPLLGPNGSPIAYDGFVIGWDDGNDAPSIASLFVTRLAFPESSGGRFEANGKSRHGEGIHVLRADGSAGTFTPDRAGLERIGGEVAGPWAGR